MRELAGQSIEVRAGAARNPNAPEELLRELARDPKVTVRAAVAANPNAPSELVRELAGQTTDVRAGAARNPNTPEELLRELAQAPDQTIKLALAANPSAPVDLLQRLATDWHSQLREAAAENPSTPKATVELFERAVVDSGGITGGKTLNADLPVEDAVELASPQYATFAALLAARHPALPSETLARLATHDARQVRECVARHENATTPILRELVGDLDRSVRRSAQARATAPRDLVELFERTCEEHPVSKTDKLAVEPAEGISQQDLIRLGELDMPPLAHYLAAQHPSTAADVLALLGDDPDDEVRLKLAANPSTPIKVLEMFFHNDADGERDDEVCLALVHNPALPDALLAKLARVDSSLVRQRVAQSPRTPHELLRELVDDREYEVRRALARRDSLPDDIAMLLVEDEREKVRFALAHRVDLPEAIIREIAGDSESNVRGVIASREDAPLDVLDKLAKDRAKRVKRRLAKNPAVSPESLEMLASSGDTRIRQAVSRNPSTPGHVLQALADDATDDVARSAQYELETRDS